MKKLLSVVLFFVMSSIQFVGASEYQDLGPVAKKILNESPTAPVFSESFGSHCSATYVTNDGYFLLALHCLRNCLRFGGLRGNIKYSAIDYENTGDDNWITHIDIKKAKKLTCGFNGSTAKIISLGAKGFVNEGTYYKLAKKNPKKLESLLQDGFDGLGAAGDFALMKVDETSLTEETLERSKRMKRPGECFPVATSNAQINDPVWSLNFPALGRATMRETYEPLVTAGTIIPRNKLSGYTPEMFRPEQDATSLDSESGASGASYFDKDGKIRGIIVSTANPEDRYEYGTTVGIQIEHMLKSFKRDLSKDVYEKIISDCSLTETTKSLIAEIVGFQP